jgi:hypothetical protein
MTTSEIHLIPGPAGWVQARFTTADGRRRVFVRCEPDAAGRWQPAELSVPHPTPGLLRELPFHRIAAAVNANEAVTAELGKRLAEEPEEGFRAAFGEARPVRTPLAPLKRPPGRRLDDNFYARVALVYKQAVGRGVKPRLAIAEQAGVSTDVAGRWVREARKRHLIPKTTPCKVTT